MSNIQSGIGEITEILSQWNHAKKESLDKVFPKVYQALKRLAKRARRDMGRRNPEETLCTTALANELYFNLQERKSDGFRNSGHFYAVCLVTMRRMLMDYYFRRVSKTRTEPFAADFEPEFENLVNLPFLTQSEYTRFNKLELIILVNELLTKLAAKHPQKAEVLYLKYLLGATENEISECLGINERTVRRRRNLGELLLKLELEKQDSVDGVGKSVRSRNIRIERVRGEASRMMLKDLEAILREHHGTY